MTPNVIAARNRFSLLALGLAYPAGAGGVGLGAVGHMLLGGLCFVLAFGLLGIVITLCFINMKAESQIESSDRAVVQRLMKQGLLESYMQGTT